MINWLMNHVFYRKRYREFLEESARLDQNAAMISTLRQHPLVQDIDQRGMAKRYPDLASQYPEMFE